MSRVEQQPYWRRLMILAMVFVAVAWFNFHKMVNSQSESSVDVKFDPPQEVMLSTGQRTTPIKTECVSVFAEPKGHLWAAFARNDLTPHHKSPYRAAGISIASGDLKKWRHQASYPVGIHYAPQDMEIVRLGQTVHVLCREGTSPLLFAQFTLQGGKISEPQRPMIKEIPKGTEFYSDFDAMVVNDSVYSVLLGKKTNLPSIYVLKMDAKGHWRMEHTSRLDRVNQYSSVTFLGLDERNLFVAIAEEIWRYDLSTQQLTYVARLPLGYSLIFTAAGHSIGGQRFLYCFVGRKNRSAPLSMTIGIVTIGKRVSWKPLKEVAPCYDQGLSIIPVAKNQFAVFYLPAARHTATGDGSPEIEIKPVTCMTLRIRDKGE